MAVDRDADLVAQGFNAERLRAREGFEDFPYWWAGAACTVREVWRDSDGDLLAIDSSNRTHYARDLRALDGSDWSQVKFSS